ncbi:hypothetical protein Q1695_007907 [Nippostrongylus brasiliensis]|nr:hypothetical protein Q1695_007907 [Nippostrongylus brasiliensis]
MTTTLFTRQRLQTKACSRLTALLKNQEELLRQPEGSMATNSKILIQQFQKAKIAIADGINGVEQALEKYTSEADSLSVETPSFNDIMKKVVVNSETAQDLLDNANKKLGEFLEKEYEVKNAEIQRAKTKANEAPQLALPPVPIPKFDGKIWEWETFWGAFNHSVHSRNMDDLHKMNYLLDALQGEVRNSVKQYEISRTTYPAVISYLQEKYGDKQALLDQILRRLQSAKARSSRLEDQESLCEILIALVSQLEPKGEHIDNIFLQKQFLGKFSVEVQHQILREEQHRSPNTTWGSKDILAIAKAYIHAEKKIIHHIEKLEHHQTTRTEAIGRMPTSVKTKGPSAPPHSRSSRQAPSKRPPNQHDTRPKSLRNPPATKTNCVISNQEDREETVADTVLHVGSDKHQPDSLILVGQALVFNPQTQNLETVYVMLDSGADRSFVSIDLARRLRLPEKESTVLKLNTFGSATPVTKNCSTTEIKLWDREGIPHSYFVTTVDVLTEPISRNTLSPEDKGFLYGNDIVLSISPTTSKIRADLLLECADLFTLLKKDVGQQRTLPSGLKVLPSKLGYLVIGKRQPEKQDVHALFSQKANHENATTSVPSVASKTLTEERIAKQSSSTSEKSNVDTQEATAQEENDAFEDNALTIRSSSEESSDEEITRILETILAKLQKDANLMKQYHEVFMNQLELGIIEEVNTNSRSPKYIHYLAHEAIITPHKETTKIRVVFDASAHIKDSPSLNEVLYQGPVLLPMLFDMLLRFRTGRIALISDVEKAFLQVRLHHEDKDATRCLWVRDPSKPLSDHNLVTYRITRVTFGLNCSPFLLAGTIRHHMRNHEDHQFAELLIENTYVDNVIFTAIFSDASTQAMATCAYLVQEGRSQLLIGKCKLPHVKNKPTVPKMEFHALGPWYTPVVRRGGRCAIVTRRSEWRSAWQLSAATPPVCDRQRRPATGLCYRPVIDHRRPATARDGRRRPATGMDH